jgi:hypothetical protein
MKHGFMNFDILKLAISQTAKLVWHVIKAGIRSPIEIARKIGRGRSTINRALVELRDLNLVIHVHYGDYSVAEMQHSEIDCCETATLRSKNATQCSETAMECTQNATVCSVARTYLSKVKQSKERDLKNIPQAILSARRNVELWERYQHQLLEGYKERDLDSNGTSIQVEL